jgi:hypothetical protein
MKHQQNVLAPRSPRQPARSIRPTLEVLEDRLVPTVTAHYGVVLPHVEVQALYLGSDWVNNPTLYAQTGSLEGYLGYLVNSPYMDMLTNAGYGVGRGSATAGQIDPVGLAANSVVPDSYIQQELQYDINRGVLARPDSNRLYVVFVQDNVLLQTSLGYSDRNFGGYHYAFAGTDGSGYSANIHYAVIPYPGGTVGNLADPTFLSPLDNMTEVTSHEVAESATDPNPEQGWVDDQRGEVGDSVAWQHVRLGGWVVQRLVDQNDQAMTPAGAAPDRAVSFTLLQGGALYEHSAAGWTGLASGVASISDQGIDNAAHAFIGVTFSAGYAYEYHDTVGWTFLGYNAASVKAGQGASYVLFNGGYLYEYRDSDASLTYLDGSVALIDAGTDRFGVNKVDVVFSTGSGWERSDTSSWHQLVASGVQSISAGQQGNSEVLVSGYAYHYSEWTNALSSLGSGVAQVRAGVDANGNAMIDLLFSSGVAYEWRSGIGWVNIGGSTPVLALSKGHQGVVDILFNGEYAYEYNGAGYTYLTSSAIAVA